VTERVVAIIQARMGSTRLPGKVLMPLAGKPILWHILHRLRKCRTITEVVIATSDQSCDDALVDFAHSCNVRIFRGSEENVLQRFLIAARDTQADYIVRVTGDAPLVHPETIDLLVTKLLLEQADYCRGGDGLPTIHEGFDPCSRKVLERLAAEAGDDPIAQEHVTAYFKLYPEFAKSVIVALPPGYEIDGVRTSVDTPDDLLFLETLYQRLHAEPGELDLLQVVKLLHGEPELKQINAHIVQKDVASVYGRILIRADGSPQLGLGHLVRCLALAEEFRSSYGLGVYFALLEDGVGGELVRRRKFPVMFKTTKQTESQWLDDLIERFSPQALILDIRTDLNAGHFPYWRKLGVKVVVIDDPSSERRFAADLAFYPPVPQLTKADRVEFSGEAFIGWEYLLLRPEFGHRIERKEHTPPRVFVCMGGSDPGGFTLTAIAALQRLQHKFQATVVLGAAFMHAAAVAEIEADLPESIRIQRDVDQIASLMQESDLALASYGGIALELAALGVPALLFCLTSDHVDSAQALVAAGMARTIPAENQKSVEQVTDLLNALLSNGQLRQKMRQACRQVDGQGTARVARIINDRSGGRRDG